MTRIKICGLTNLEDARAAIACGADMLGFNFYRPSPRFIEPQDAQAIIKTLRAEIKDLPRSVTMVGVFVNEASAESVARIAEPARLDAIQLHGDESAGFCEELKAVLPNRFLIKVISTPADATEQAREYDVDAIMLDAFDRELRGGTGRTVDWDLARRIAQVVPRLFLAGGLSPENVAAAISEVQPYAVDACTALESSAGHKDAGRMKAFVHAVRNG